MIKFLRISIFLAVCIAPIFTQAQNLDSLIKVTPTLSNKEQAFNYGELCYYYASFDTDSAALFGKKGLQLAIKIGDSAGVALAANDYSFAFINNGEYAKALPLNERAYRIRKSLKDTVGILSSLSKIAVSQRELGNTDKALEGFFESLHIAILLKDELKQAVMYDNIGTLYKMKSLFDKAIEYHKKGLKILKKYPESLEISHTYANIGAVYLKSNAPKKALPYLKKAEVILEETDNKQAMASIYLNFGAAYAALNNQGKRLYYATKALKTFESLGDVSGISTVYHNLHLYYLENDDLKKSKENAEKCLQFANQSGSQQVLLDAYKALARVYLVERNNDSSSYYEGLRDSTINKMSSLEMSKSLADSEIRYQTAEKEAQILKQEVALSKADLAVKTRTNWILGLSVLVLLVAFIAFTVYRQQTLKQERLQAEAKLQEEVAKAEMRARVQEERVRISRDLHDHIGAQLTVITSSIDNMAFRESDTDKKQRFDVISDQTRDTIAQLRETIWAMNNEAIEVEMLVSKLREYTGKINALSEGSEAHIEINTASEHYNKLGPAQTIALFRVCQEAINNALKYAQFKHLQVSFSKTIDGKDLRVEISDDGAGFNVEEALARGYGLANMQQRIKDVNGTIRFASEPSKGTTISIEIPVHTALDKI